MSFISHLGFIVGMLLCGYAGFQTAGWMGAVLLPIGVLGVMMILVAPILTLAVFAGVIIRAIQAFRTAKRRILGVRE